VPTATCFGTDVQSPGAETCSSWH